MTVYFGPGIGSKENEPSVANICITKVKIYLFGARTRTPSLGTVFLRLTGKKKWEKDKRAPGRGYPDAVLAEEQ